MVSYNPKLFLLFFILVAFVTLFKLYYPNSSTLVHDKHLDRNLSEDEVFQLFKDWKKEYGRVYKDHEEMAKKFGIFISNLNYIIESNARRTSPSSHILGLNKFSDWSDEEFNETYLNNEEMLIEDNDIPTENHIEMNNLSYTEVPSSLDWRVKGAVTAVKNQMTPPFCWAFSAVGAIEGIHAIVTNNLISLSEQELVDCVTENHLGKRTDGFKWVINNGGIASDADYPYTGQKGTCQASKVANSASITSYAQVPQSDNALLSATAIQPISVGVDASGMRPYNKNSGIYEGGECSIDTKLNHGLLIVGYDRSEEGVDYWIAKNSWGKDWGKDGYIWILRNTDLPYGVCGINKKAYYPKINVRSLASV